MALDKNVLTTGRLTNLIYCNDDEEVNRFMPVIALCKAPTFSVSLRWPLENGHRRLSMWKFQSATAASHSGQILFTEEALAIFCSNQV